MNPIFYWFDLITGNGDGIDSDDKLITMAADGRGILFLSSV